jgi:hypothetical protein
MTKRRVQLFSVLLSLSFVVSAMLFARFAFAQETVRPQTIARETALAELAGYRQWVRVNEKPLQVFNAAAIGGG